MPKISGGASGRIHWDAGVPSFPPLTPDGPAPRLFAHRCLGLSRSPLSPWVHPIQGNQLDPIRYLGEYYYDGSLGGSWTHPPVGHCS
jgi:hypothetical protein